MPLRDKLAPFFANSRKYIVIGASENPEKFGNKVVQFYKFYKLPVVPVNPKKERIHELASEANISDVFAKYGANLNSDGSGGGWAVSFVTRPSITLAIIDNLIADNANKNGMLKAFWFQPGTYDDDIISKSKNILKVGIVIADDYCILVNGAAALKIAKQADGDSW